MRQSRIASLLALLVLVLLAAGCAEEPAPAAPAASTPAAAPEIALAIAEPGLKPITARGENGELRTTAEVSGTAPAGDLVQISSGCDEPGCSTGASVDAAGTWSVRVLLVGSGERRANVKLVAQSGAQVALGLARLQVPKAKRTRSAAKRATRRSTHTVPAVPVPAPSASAATTAPEVQAPATSGPASRMAMVGDSLSLGTKAPLSTLLSGWSVSTDGRVGRPLAEGMRIIRTLGSPPPVLAVSLFTNDSPANVSALQAAVRETIAMQAGRGCVIWATIVRPPVGGRSYDAANQALARLADANPSVMRLVPWAAQVAQHPEWVGGDGVHATSAGYAARAQMYAAAARDCAAD